MSDKEAQKQAAAKAAVEYVESGMLVGLGTGTTAAYAIRFLGDRVRSEGLKIIGVPTSSASRDLASSVGIPILPDQEGFDLDIAIDGADQVTRAGDAIKGGGGAMLHERIVAASARQFIIIGDSTKLVDCLGSHSLPIEVYVFGWKNVLLRLQAIGGKATLRQKEGEPPFRTAEDNLIIDYQFNSGVVPPLVSLDQDIRAIVGVADHGLFCGMAHRILIGQAEKVEEIIPTYCASRVRRR